jgi:hypothetical protein
MLTFKLPARWLAGAMMVLLAALSACGGDGDVPQPTLSATLPTTGSTGTAVSITAIVEANGKSMSVDWGDGTTDNEPTVASTSLSHTYSTAGSYAIVLTLRGTAQTKTQQTGTVVISAPPTLSATLPTIGVENTAVSITGIAAANGTALSVNWGDGTTETPAVSVTSLSHTYTAAASYTIDLVLSGVGTPAEQTGTVVISAVSTAELFISEYIEGSSSNKALEIYNPTTGTVDLSLYSLATYSNGGTTTGYTKALTGTLAPGKALVIYNPSAGTALVTATATASSTYGATVLVDGAYPSQVTLYNGNDAVVLMKSGTVIDSFGVVGNDPGTTGWGAITTDHTLRRKAGIVHGTVPDATATWDPTVEWDTYAKDTFDGLGSR